MGGSDPVDVVGAATVSDRAGQRSHEVDLVAMRAGKLAALGEAKLRRLGTEDLDLLSRIGDLLGADDAALVLASATGVDLPGRSADGEQAQNLVALGLDDVYG